jgi:hypothetical protein
MRLVFKNTKRREQFCSFGLDPVKKIKEMCAFGNIQGDFESCADILITSYWLHVELGKNV